jgi:hypothetical protein
MSQNFSGKIQEVNGMYLFAQLDAEMSVKYIPATPVNHAGALRCCAGGAAILIFSDVYQ